MHKQKIKAMLVERGIRQVDIARELGLKKETVNTVLNNHGTSRRVKEHIAKRLGRPVEYLWPKQAA